MILAQRELLAQEQAERIAAQSEAKVIRLEIERLKLLLAKARREKFGQSSERGKQLIEQLELAIEDLEETQGAEEAKAEIAAPEATRKRTSGRRAGRASCRKICRSRDRRAGALRLRQMRRQEVAQARRGRDQDAGKRTPALENHRACARKIHLPRLRGDHRTAGALASDRARIRRPQPAGDDPGVEVPVASAAQSPERHYAREGIEIDTSTLADWVGACVVTLDPILALLKAHVLRGERIHADDTTVPVLAKGKTATGRLWTYVRDDRPFGGKEPPAAFFEYSRNRAGVHPQKHLAGWTGIMQADAYNGYNALYEATWKPAPIKEAACWAHWRRKLFDHAKSGKAPIAVEAVRRMDEIFAWERTIPANLPMSASLSEGKPLRRLPPNCAPG